VAGVLHHGEVHVRAGQHLEQAQPVLPGHVLIGHAVNDAHRAAGVEPRRADEVPAAILDQRAGYRVGVLGIGGGPHEDPCRLYFLAHVLRKALPHQRLGHVPGGGDQHEPRQPPALPCGHQPAGEKQRDPPAHARADRDDGPFRMGGKDGPGFLQPVADGAAYQGARRAAMPGIVEAQAGAALLRGPGGKHAGLGARHVGV